MARVNKFWIRLAFAVVGGAAFLPQAEAQQDCTQQNYQVDFSPWAGRKTMFRDVNGNFLGYSKTEAPFRIVVSGNDLRAADTPNGADIRTLLRNMSPVDYDDGNTYIRMKLMKDAALEDGTVLSGSSASQTNEVLININDFYISKTMQPTVAYTCTPDSTVRERLDVSHFNDTLAREGVTEETKPEDRIEDAEPLPPLADETEEDEQDTTPSGYVVALGRGEPFPSRFLSSPLCSASGETHVTTSGMGRRGRRGRDGRCRASNGRVMSCNHKGLDIAARVGTPVLAAADGCFKVKKSEGRSHLPARGTRIDKGDLREGGYGYTIRLTHGNDWETQYSHLSRLSPKVCWGMCVKRGEIIGYSGNTGQVTGAHFHFGVAHGRRIMNPVSSLISTTGSFLSPSCSNIPKFTELDQRMRAALRGGASSVGSSSSGSRSVR